MKRAIFLWLIGCLPAAAEMVPFVIPAGVHPDSAIRMDSRPLTQQDRLHADGHFLTESGRRVRLWGVNLTFEANFPTHADARQIAERLAAFGVNAVRCHHMDTAQWPRGIWDDTGRRLHPEALDRLDYFIAQLAERGIYTNLNLQVGRKHSDALGLPDPLTEYNKMAAIFTPQLVEAQKDYARRLLTHANPYRGNVPYARDYAVAIVEITNENSLFMWDSEKALRALPPFYADILQRQYNQWLQQKYGTTERLRQVWDQQAQPLGDANLLQDSIPLQGWRLEQHEQAKAAVSPLTADEAAGGVTIEIARADGIGWHLQYNHPALRIEQGRFYTVILKARAAAARPLTVSMQQAHEPWANLGLYRDIQLSPDWQTFTLGFAAVQGDDNSRLNLAFGTDSGAVQLALVQLRTGGQVGVGPDESLEQASVALFAESAVPARQTDWMCFLAQTEKAYFDQMRAFLKNDLDCRAMVTGTIVFGPLGLYAQSGMDFIDSHAYWQHPQFPRRPWDSGDWLIEQKAMSGNPPGTLYELAAERLAGKPFTVSEYNHPAPLDSQAECVPMIASFAAAQDWDGVWIYTYSHSNNQFSRQHLNSYFDIDTNPAKWGFMPAGAVLFSQGALEPFARKTTAPLAASGEPVLEALARLHLQIDRNLASRLGGQETIDAFWHTLQPAAEAQTAAGGSDDAAVLEWKAQDGRGLYWMHSSKAEVFCGDRSRLDKGRHRLQIDQPDAAAVVLTALDGRPLAASQSMLIAACGRCENTGMQFSADRRTVGRSWGTAPVRIEPVAGTLALPVPAGRKLTLKPLNPDGTVKAQIPIENGIAVLKAEYGTMWYLVQQ